MNILVQVYEQDDDGKVKLLWSTLVAPAMKLAPKVRGYSCEKFRIDILNKMRRKR